MKKFTLMLMAALVAMTSYAQIATGGLKQVAAGQSEQKLYAPQGRLQAGAQQVKKHAKKAPRKAIASVDELVGKVIVASTYYDYNQEDGLFVSSPAAGGTAAQVSKVDDTTIKISGFVYGATEDVTATVDLEAATVSIAAEQKLYDSQYGTVLLGNASSEGDLKGVINEDGSISIDDLWYQLLGDGNYAGYRLGLYNASDICAANGTMTYTYQNAEETIDVLLLQDEASKRVAIYNFADWETAIVAVLHADKTFSISNQLVGSSSNGDFYTYGLSDDESSLQELTGTGTATELTFDCKFTAYASTGYWYGSHGPATITLTDGTEFSYPADVTYPDPIALPEGVTSSTYTVEADDMYWGEAEPYEGDVQVAFDGSDVYFQGLSTWLGSAWVKGTLADGKVSIPATYLGQMDGLGVPMHFFFRPAEFTYDAAAGQFKAAEGYTSYAEYDLGDGELTQEDADVFANVVITKTVELPATPATPVITLFENTDYGYHIKYNIPVEDVAGNSIFASKLSWQLFSNTNGKVEPFVFQADLYDYLNEDMTVVPYNFTDFWDIDNTEAYLYGDGIENWQFVGIKAYYTGGGEKHESATCWWDIAQSTLPGPVGIDAVKEVVQSSSVLYNMNGQRVGNALRKGLYIRDGKKVVVK